MERREGDFGDDFVLRQATFEDRWPIQKLVWQFTRTEGIELDIRIFGYYLLILAGILLALTVQLWIQSLDIALAVKLTVLLTSSLTCFAAVLLVTFLGGQIIFKFTGALSNWSRFWVIEKQEEIVACAILNTYKANSELAYLFVETQYRGLGLGSRLVEQLIQAAPTPIYLACKPKMVPFYRSLDFIQMTWEELPEPVKPNFIHFKPHPKLWGFQIQMMTHASETATPDSEIASTAQSPSSLAAVTEPR